MPDGIIDITVNPWTPLEVEQGQVGVDEHFYDKIRVPPEARVGLSWEKYLEKKDRAGVQRSLLVATRAGDSRARFSFHIPYERVAETCAKWPDRFSGLAGIDPTRGMEGLREFERGITEYGFVGGHIYPHWFDLPPDHRSFYPFYAKACELDVPIMMQIGHCLDYQRDKIFHSVGRPITLENIAIDLPEVKLIGIHLGWPWTDEMIAVAYKHNNVYMAGDAYAPKHWPKEYVHFHQHLGPGQVSVRHRLACNRSRACRRRVRESRPAARVKGEVLPHQRAQALQAAGVGGDRGFGRRGGS